MPKEESVCVLKVQKMAVELGSATCHGAAQAVFDCLKEGKVVEGKGWMQLIGKLSELDSSVYRVDLGFQREGKDCGWAHSFALLTLGTKFYVYQAYVNSYTLWEWIQGKASHGPTKTPSPKKGGMNKLQFFEWLYEASKVAQAQIKAKEEFPADSFQERARALFGGKKIQYKTVGMSAKTAEAFNVSWKKSSV